MDDDANNVCNSILSNNSLFDGEGYMAASDVMQATRELEMARWATTTLEVAGHLADMAMWLRRAQQAFGARGDEFYADRAACAATTAEGYVADQSWATNLPQFQSDTLYRFAGILAALAGDAGAVQSRSATVTLLAVAGTYFGASFVHGWRKVRPAPEGVLARAGKR